MKQHNNTREGVGYGEKGKLGDTKLGKGTEVIEKGRGHSPSRPSPARTRYLGKMAETHH